MRILTIFILTLLNLNSFSQELNISPAELDSLYVKALNNNYGHILSSGWKYVELNKYGSRIKNLNVSDRYKFFTYEELIKLSLKRNENISLIRLTHEIISKDTIDINFGTVILSAKRQIHFNNGLRFIKANLGISCGGTNGYQPDVRFVFNEEKKIWKLIISQLNEKNE